MTDVSASGGAAAVGAEPPVGADELRERLLRAAAAVFARQGYDGTKIMDIVRESGLSTGAVYGRFRSKNDLLREAIVTRSPSAARLGSDGIDRVADLIAAGVTHTDRPLTDAEALRLEAYVTARREPEVAQALADSDAVFRERMAPLAGRGAARRHRRRRHRPRRRAVPGAHPAPGPAAAPGLGPARARREGLAGRSSSGSWPASAPTRPSHGAAPTRP